MGTMGDFEDAEAGWEDRLRCSVVPLLLPTGEAELNFVVYVCWDFQATERILAVVAAQDSQWQTSSRLHVLSVEA